MRRLGLSLVVTVMAASLAACGKSATSEQANGAPPVESEQPGTVGEALPAQLSDAEKQAVLASLPAPYNAADLKNGQAKFALCRSCHTITPGGANMTGPNLYGVFGRKAGEHEGFRYSDVLEESDIVWDAQHLDQWLSKPQTYLPGTKMSFAGVKDPKDRADLIAFLMVESGHKPK